MCLCLFSLCFDSAVETKKMAGTDRLGPIRFETSKVN